MPFKNELMSSKEKLINYIEKCTEYECQELFMKFKNFLEPIHTPRHGTCCSKSDYGGLEEKKYNGQINIYKPNYVEHKMY